MSVNYLHDSEVSTYHLRDSKVEATAGTDALKFGECQSCFVHLDSAIAAIADGDSWRRSQTARFTDMHMN